MHPGLLLIALIPPPIVTASPSPQSVKVLIEFVPAEVECGAGKAEPTHIELPFSTTAVFGTSQLSSKLAYRLTFAIDGEGRAVSIRQVAQSGPGPYLDTSDLAPALAVWRFAAGSPKRECTLEFAAQITEIAKAPRENLMRLVAGPSGGPRAQDAFKLTLPVGSTCMIGGWPAPRTINYPAFETVPVEPGRWWWSYVAFDIDAAGATENVRLIGSGGSAALDEASVAAASANRYEARERRGCAFHFFRRSSLPLSPPPRPKPGENSPASCPSAGAITFAGPIENYFPVPFQRRSIEGWARLRFDTAPWGGIGDVEIIAAEPSDAFGEAARRMLAVAKVPESETGAAGCYQTISFQMPAEGSETPQTLPLAAQ